MNRLIRSPVTKAAALLGGYAAALSVVRTVSSSFDAIVGDSFGYILLDRLRVRPPVFVLLFVLCAAVFFLSVYLSGESGFARATRRLDFPLTLVLTYCAVVLCTHAVLRWRPPMTRLLFSIAAYVTVMTFLTYAIIQWRDRAVGSYWLKFFMLYPMRRPFGLLMAVLLAAHLFYLGLWLVTGPVLTSTGMFVFSAFSLTALTYFCAFMLSLSAEYERANAEKIRAERFKAELITNVSHDIRTPLTAIITYVDLLKALPINHSDFQDYVTVLDRKATRLKTLISDLMDASKAATGNIEADLQPVDLIEIIGQIAGEFDEPFARRGLTLVFRQPEQAVTALADRRHLWRVLENLFGNAAKYALSGTRVFAEIAVTDGDVAFSLKNTSQNPIDLPADALTEQFIRGDRARSADGNGLGLYIAKSLVELMGGRFTVRANGDLFAVEMMFTAGL